jgi:hypothetical protein
MIYSIGQPQLGHDFALSLNSLPHSTHEISAMISHSLLLMLYVLFESLLELDAHIDDPVKLAVPIIVIFQIYGLF